MKCPKFSHVLTIYSAQFQIVWDRTPVGSIDNWWQYPLSLNVHGIPVSNLSTPNLRVWCASSTILLSYKFLVYITHSATSHNQLQNKNDNIKYSGTWLTPTSYPMTASRSLVFSAHTIRTNRNNTIGITIYIYVYVVRQHCKLIVNPIRQHEHGERGKS